MAVGFDAKMTAGNSGSGTYHKVIAAQSLSTTGMTVGGSATLLVVVVVTGAGSGHSPLTSLAATWNGVSLTNRADAISQVTAFAQAVILTLVNPTPGNQTLALTWVNTNDVYVSAVSFTGTDTTTGINASDSTTTTQTETISVTSDANGATVAVGAADGDDPALNFIEIFSEAPDNPGGGASYQLGGTSNGHNFNWGTGTRQALAGVHVIASSSQVLQIERTVFDYIG
jgi:hypothetical protein